MKRFFRLAFLPLLIISLIFISSCNEQGKGRIVSIETNKGTFKFVLFEEKAPVTTKNFIDLATSRFYDGLTFHRYVPGFVIQGGDPKGDGTGGSSKTIPLEVNSALTHEEGALGMARSQDPNSASSQFYVCLAPAHQLDGSYAVFGKVTEGMDVVKNLRVGDKMNKVTILEPVNVKESGKGN
jgi:peptidyl-prolyl cis-trans isomerase B (cyclophilin B)